MTSSPIAQSSGLSPKSFVNLFLVIGLIGIAMGIIQQQLVVAMAIIAMPIAVLIGLYGLGRPYFIYWLYAVWAFTFITIMRYLRKEGLSVVLDILMVYALLSIMLTVYLKGERVWHKAVNLLTISYLPWIAFTLLQFLNPYTRSDSMMTGLRNWIGETMVLYIILSILSDRWKALHTGLMTASVVIAACFFKLLWQRYVGFDSAEKHFLYAQGAATTHIIHSGIRYFSFISDAATFGTLMATAGLVYGIVSFNAIKVWHRWWYAIVAFMGIMGLLLSGTRGAMVIPLGGMVLYTLLCKNFKIFGTTAALGITIVVFFAFTDIGNGNSFIKRARTAFRPSEDASMNVRLDNRVLIADYMKRNPFGAGIAHMVPILRQADDGTYHDDIIPSDSYYVGIWSQTGYIGLFLLLAIHAVTIAGCSIIVMFRVKDPRLRQILAAFTCAAFGIYVSGYSSYSPGQPPINFIIPAMIAFVMNAKYLDKDFETLTSELPAKDPSARNTTEADEKPSLSDPSLKLLTLNNQRL